MLRVSSNRENWENRELAGKFYNPGKTGKLPGNVAKRRKIREYPLSHIIFGKEKLRSPFLPFLSRKKFITLFYFNNLQQLKKYIF